MIWFDDRTVAPETTPIVPLPSVRTAWSTPGTLISWVQFSRSTQNWNSPGLSPRSAPTSKVTTTATLTGMGSAPSRAAQKRSAGARCLRTRAMFSAVDGRSGGRPAWRPTRRGRLEPGSQRLGRLIHAGGGVVQGAGHNRDVVGRFGPVAQLDGLADGGDRLGCVARVEAGRVEHVLVPGTGGQSPLARELVLEALENPVQPRKVRGRILQIRGRRAGKGVVVELRALFQPVHGPVELLKGHHGDIGGNRRGQV